MVSIPHIKPQVYFKFNPQLLPIAQPMVENKHVENQIGKKIQKALKDQHKTQTWLAEEVGVSNYAVTKWIKGESNVGRENIPKVAAALGIPVSAFFTGEDGDKQLETLVIGWRFLDQQQKTMLSQFYDALTKSKNQNNNTQ